MMILSKKKLKKIIIYRKTYKYLHYKNVFLDENTKLRFLDLEKLKKATQICKCPKKNSYLFHEDVLINQRTLMFSKNYWFRTGLYLV